MKKIFRKLLDKVVNLISEKWYNKILLKRAVTSAKNKWLKSGKQHFVLFIDNNYLVINKKVVLELNKKKYKKNKISHRQLMDMSVYVTPASSYINV